MDSRETIDIVRNEWKFLIHLLVRFIASRMYIACILNTRNSEDNDTLDSRIHHDKYISRDNYEIYENSEKFNPSLESLWSFARNSHPLSYYMHVER